MNYPLTSDGKDKLIIDLQSKVKQLEEENRQMFQTNAELHAIIDEKDKQIQSIHSQLEQYKSKYGELNEN